MCMDSNLIQYVQIYNVPTVCKNCGGVLVYKGLGEYYCEKCREKDYDNYGKTRNYIEKIQGHLRWILKKHWCEQSCYP